MGLHYTCKPGESGREMFETVPGGKAMGRAVSGLRYNSLASFGLLYVPLFSSLSVSVLG